MQKLLPLRPAARIVLVAITAAIMVIVGADPALAYNLEGPRWSNQPSSGCSPCAYFNIQYNPLYPADSVAYDYGRYA